MYTIGLHPKLINISTIYFTENVLSFLDSGIYIALCWSYKPLKKWFSNISAGQINIEITLNLIASPRNKVYAQIGFEPTIV